MFSAFAEFQRDIITKNTIAELETVRGSAGRPCWTL
ncbi:hypothetical protein [Roseobacter sp. MH60115]